MRPKCTGGHPAGTGAPEVCDAEPVVTDETATLAPALSRYAAAFHGAVGSGHHVASPLGAWMLLALVAPASEGAARAELEGVLGVDAGSAARVVADLLEHPHPAVAAAVATWSRAEAATPGLRTWLGGLPAAVERGPVPGQREADRWAAERTQGLIDRFPLDLGPMSLLVLASALATRVSWRDPFEVVPADRLGADSAWASRLHRALLAPRRHRQLIAATEEAGDVAVHAAGAVEGLLVTSVIAAPAVPMDRVLAAADRIARALAAGEDPARRRLADLPLGEGPAWTLREEEAAGAVGAERYETVLPAWAARSDHDLTGPRALGFPAAAAALAPMIRGAERLQARQSAMARYSSTGFEAAAVTGMQFFRHTVPAPHLVRTAQIRFGHPFAVVAVCEADGGPWAGLPVFSAWVAEPEDAEAAPSG